MKTQFQNEVAVVTAWLAGRSLDARLAADLAARFPAEGAEFKALADSCRAGVRDGWLAQNGAPPVKWGRVVKPGPETNHFSIDVVEMTAVAGPFHVHPTGEIDMIVPLDPEARFDGQGEGWMVYGPGSAHAPTVTGGRAIILYLLPGGEIEFQAA